MELLLDTYLSIWILKHPKYNRLFNFKKEVFLKFAILEIRWAVLRKSSYIKDGTVLVFIIEDFLK
jgi:hypothetical protein